MVTGNPKATTTPKISDSSNRPGQGWEWAARFLPAWLSQAARYGIVGVINTGIDFGVFWALLSFTALPLLPANVIAFSCGAANSFALNRWWTFRIPALPDSQSPRPWARQAVGFAVVTLLGLFCSTAVVLALAPHMGAITAKAISVLVTFAVTFILNRRFVFSA